MRLHHVGIAVDDIDAAVERYQARTGAGLYRRGETPAGLRFALLDAGTELELLWSGDPATPIGRFLAERGPGLHHLAFAVADLDAERERLLSEGLEQVDDVRVGVHGTRIVFFHPRGMGGVLTELVEDPERA